MREFKTTLIFKCSEKDLKLHRKTLVMWRYKVNETDKFLELRDSLNSGIYGITFILYLTRRYVYLTIRY